MTWSSSSRRRVGLAKPDPRIFDLAAERLGLPRSGLLFVGDHFGDDIVGARSAGFDAVLVDYGFRAPGPPCPRIGRLLDLVRYVRQPAGPARALLFDFDGVVLDSFSTHLRTWQETLGTVGIRLEAVDLARNEGLPTEPMVRLFVQKLLGRESDGAEAARLTGMKRTLYARYLQPRPIPGMIQLLHDLHGRGYRLGLVTGGIRRDVEVILGGFGVLGLFSVVVTSEDTEKGKPSPEPYLAAAAALGMRPPECLVIENAPPGIQSARAAGMACVALETTLPAGELQGADRTFRSGMALSDWLLSF